MILQRFLKEKLITLLKTKDITLKVQLVHFIEIASDLENFVSFISNIFDEKTSNIKEDKVVILNNLLKIYD